MAARKVNNLFITNHQFLQGKFPEPMTRIVLLLLTLCLLPLRSLSQELSTLDSLALFHETTALNSGRVAQEIIYLHLDNTSYYQGERIYFACYLMTSDGLRPSNLSQTVYVELLNPSGKVIDKCVLKAVDGRCHGSLSVNETPFYSGYYEIRAFTRYMLNFGDEAIFTRVIPVFNKPKTEGDFSERSMLKYGSRERTFLRPKPQSHDKVEAKFYPEGGRLISSLPARVGVEITDSYLRPVATSGSIVDQKTDSVVATFTTCTMGRGSFNFTPDGGRKYRAEFDFEGKKRTFNLPKSEPSGIALNVDNLSNPDSVTVTVSRSANLPATLIGASLSCRGRIYSRAIIDLSDDLSASFTTSRAKLPTGVINVTLFSPEGTTIADRLFFNNRNDFITLDYEFDKAAYSPYEPVNLNLKLSTPTPVSLSVTDAENRVAYFSDILADLLLASEVKGYVHNPSYYFAEPADPGRQRELDEMLMIQGWRKYSWQQLAGLEPYPLDLTPEKGIEVHGRVLSRFTDKPQKNASISAMITNMSADSTNRKLLFLDSFDTDDNGNFAFRTAIEGKAMMTLSPVRKKSIKSYRILLNSDRYPATRGYDRAEMVTEIDTTFHPLNVAIADTDTIAPIEELDLGADTTRLLDEVEVRARASRWTRANILSNASVCHDIESEYNDMLDHGAKNIRSLIDILLSIDKKFTHQREILYDARSPLFIVEGDKFMENKGLTLVKQDENFITAEQLMALDVGERVREIAEFKIIGNCNPLLIPVEYIKNVYVSTRDDAIYHYLSEYFPGSLDDLERMKRRVGCVVLIELNPMMPAQMKKGMRRVVLEGYTTEPVEFYSPDYSQAPPVETDFRRTLYWNPDLLPDADGNIKINFFNNSYTRHPRVSAAYLPFPTD